MTTFAALAIGAKFTFASNVGFFHTCTKLSARLYEWEQNGITYKSQVGRIRVRVKEIN